MPRMIHNLLCTVSDLCAAWDAHCREYYRGADGLPTSAATCRSWAYGRRVRHGRVHVRRRGRRNGAHGVPCGRGSWLVVAAPGQIRGGGFAYHIKTRGRGTTKNPEGC